eukprot:UC4_evm4s1233
MDARRLLKARLSEKGFKKQSSKKRARETDSKTFIDTKAKEQQESKFLVPKSKKRSQTTVSFKSKRPAPLQIDGINLGKKSPKPDTPRPVQGSNNASDLSDLQQFADTKSSLKSAGKASSKIPEGFFDDSRKDAKARKVEMKDEVKEQLAIFEREMVKQEKISMQMEAKHIQREMVAREHHQEAEQEQCVQRMLAIREAQKKYFDSRSTNAKETFLQGGNQEVKKGDDDDSVSDEEDWEDSMNWRRQATHLRDPKITKTSFCCVDSWANYVE